MGCVLGKGSDRRVRTVVTAVGRNFEFEPTIRQRGRFGATQLRRRGMFGRFPRLEKIPEIFPDFETETASVAR